MRIAHELGRSVAEISELSSEELALWAAWYEQEEPASETRADWRAAAMMAHFGNCLAGKNVFEAKDFMPGELNKIDAKSPEAEQAFMAWCAMAGGEVRRPAPGARGGGG